MNSLTTQLKNLDWVIIISAVLLTVLGLLSIYSSSFGQGDMSNFYKQMVFLGIGLVGMFVLSSLDYRILRNDPYLIMVLYLIGVFALLGLFFFAPEVRGIKSWYRLGGLSVDPIEYVKPILVIVAAKYLSLRHVEMYRVRHIILMGIYFGIPTFLIFLQPDLGSAGILAVMWVVILLVSGIRLRHFLVLLLLAAVLFAGSWNFVLHDYQRDRILGFVEPELDPLGIGWSQLQSKIAIGNGGISGTGLKNGTQTQYGFLSEPQTDFIFAAIAEEMGLFGVVVLFSVFMLLLWRLLKIGLRAKQNFSRLYVIGFITLLLAPFAVNIGMNLGLLPIVGVSLPLVSYGGSSLIMTYIGLGIVQSIKTH